MPKNRKPKSQLLEWVESILIALVLAVLIRSYFVQPFKIPSGSMRMTLLEGDHLFVDKWMYGPQVLPPMFWDIGFQVNFRLSERVRGRESCIRAIGSRMKIAVLLYPNMIWGRKRIYTSTS